MPRFVILEHDFPEPHLDFMLEDEGVLLTWRLPSQLTGQPHAVQTLPATRLPDHRLHYLTYEGPVSGDRGTVRQWDAGEFEWLERQPSCWRIALNGHTLQSEIEFVSQASGDEMRWRSTLR